MVGPRAGKNKTGKKTYRSKETILIKTETAIPREGFFFFGAVQSIMGRSSCSFVVV